MLRSKLTAVGIEYVIVIAQNNEILKNIILSEFVGALTVTT